MYQTGPEFIAEVFAGEPPEAKSLLLTPQLKETATEIMHRQVRGLRTRYWQSGGTTAWIMEEIGKELPITIGVVIRDDQVAQVKILAFRESRGWEVRYPAFTDQFRDVKITPELKLDKHIDGITGATLSVRAVRKVTTLALFYHQHVAQKTAKENGTLVPQTP
ncbi:FMN-binding protein [Porticoccus sp.]